MRLTVKCTVYSENIDSDSSSRQADRQTDKK